MIIDSSDFAAIPHLTSATLSEDARGVSTLALSFAGYGPDWVEYMADVTLTHKGRTVFHGKITELSRTNNGGDEGCEITVSNVLWLLDHQPLGLQMADILQARNTGTATPKAALAEAAATWQEFAGSVAVAAPGWIAGGAESGADAVVKLKTSESAGGRQLFWPATNKAMTTWTALLRLQETQPDIYYLIDYGTGYITVTALTDTPVATWDTSSVRLTSAASLTPQYEACVTGVALVSAYDDDATGQRMIHYVWTYPADLDLTQTGVRVFEVSGNFAGLPSWQETAREFYEAANELQWGGSITALMDDVVASPLGTRLDLTGPGTHASWGTMDAIVTGVTWDFVEQTVELYLGRDFADPVFAEFPEGDMEDDDTSSSTDGGGGDIDDSTDGGDDESTTDETTSTWEDTATWEDTLTGETTTDETTTTAQGTTTSPLSSTTQGSTTTQGQSTTTQGSTTASLPSTSTRSESATCECPPTIRGLGEGANAYSIGELIEGVGIADACSTLIGRIDISVPWGNETIKLYGWIDDRGYLTIRNYGRDSSPRT